ncbi:MAG TPA: nicotianamine synthase family protein [Hyphomicrobiales bacterium]|nr:nicotianamine synthase family protein [Hyphomicrobiales bacterium]
MGHTEAAVFLNAVHETLANQSDLSPENPKVNSCLNRLVATLQDWQQCGYGSDLADHPDFTGLACSLPDLCARAECEMEKWWCRRILASDCKGVQSLAAFWYLDNYQSLCRAELELLGSARETRFAFLGSGALPLTAILLAQQSPSMAVSCVDCDGEACSMAYELVSLLGLSRQIMIENKEACAYRPEADETVICASLLDAPGVFNHLDACNVSRLIVRDAEGPYRFCYRPAHLPGPEFVECSKLPLSADRINTSRYFEARVC